MPPDVAQRKGLGRSLAASALILAASLSPSLARADVGDLVPEKGATTAPITVALPPPSPSATVAPAPAKPGFDEAVPEAPKAFDGIGLTEKLGAQVPLDLPFRDQTGAAVTLRDLIRGDRPLILTFNYSDCPMLCSLQLTGLVAALPQLRLMAGRQFRIVTVVLEPLEKPARAAATRARYLERLPDTMRSLAADGGWTFLVAPEEGRDASIRRLAETVGFGYKFVPERNEWAHPAALIFLSPSGKVTRYVGDVNYSPDVLTQSIMTAGTSEPSSTAGFIMSCFHYDADVNNYSRLGVSALRYAAAGFLLLLLTAFGLWRYFRRDRQAIPGVDRS